MVLNPPSWWRSHEFLSRFLMPGVRGFARAFAAPPAIVITQLCSRPPLWCDYIDSCTAHRMARVGHVTTIRHLGPVSVRSTDFPTVRTSPLPQVLILVFTPLLVQFHSHVSSKEAYWKRAAWSGFSLWTCEA